jgi:hypothetical protein
MKLKGTPNRVINRFGKSYQADAQGYIIAENKEEMEVFIAYGYELEKEE